MSNSELLKAFGISQGISHLKFDEKGFCRLFINNEHRIIIREIDEQNLLISYVVTNSSKDLATLLSINTVFSSANGPYVGRDEETDEIMLLLPFTTDTSDAFALEEIIKYLIQNAGILV